MIARETKQPVAVVAESLMRVCYNEANRLANHGSNGLERMVMHSLYGAANDAKARLAAAADDSEKAPDAPRTAFDCSALLALAARWLEEAPRCYEVAQNLDRNGRRVDAADMRARADQLINCATQVQRECGRAAEANEKLSPG